MVSFNFKSMCGVDTEPHKKQYLSELLMHLDADIVCLQEASDAADLDGWYIHYVTFWPVKTLGLHQPKFFSSQERRGLG